MPDQVNRWPWALLQAAIYSLPLLLFAQSAIADASLPASVRVTPITDPTQLQRIRAEFQYELGHEGYVVDCHDAIDYVDVMPSGRDTSYGAICAVSAGGETREWMMCNDWMIGKFTKTDRFEKTSGAVSIFVHDHCPPGG